MGRQALEIIDYHPDRFEVVALSACTRWELLAEQANRYKPDYLLLCDETWRSRLEERLEYRPRYLFYSPEGFSSLAAAEEADVVLNCLVGFAGFQPTVAALKAGKKVALANKESLVVGGEVIRPLAGERFERLVPVDSEHSAMLQCMAGESPEHVEKVVITASGGPFRDWTREQMESIRVEDALAHPNWSMGAKITIDSSTLMNKGLEIIEAHWLFDLPYDKIEPVIHPESIIHSIVEFVDGSSKAQLGVPDMRVPIIYALTSPGRLPLNTPRIDWNKLRQLTFEPVDYSRFPSLNLAIGAGRAGGHAPAIMNAANEVAVERFLKKEIAYIDIPRIVERSLERIESHTDPTLESLKEVDREARELAARI